MDSKTFQELIEILEGQRTIINRQAKIILKIVNENAEKENYIRELSKDVINEHLDEHKDINAS